MNYSDIFVAAVKPNKANVPRCDCQCVYARLSITESERQQLLLDLSRYPVSTQICTFEIKLLNV